jgi:phosphoglycerate dehydrogenase-like enzyme
LASFGMNVIAWSENLTPERAIAAGAEFVSKEALFKQADFLSVHLNSLHEDAASPSKSVV